MRLALLGFALGVWWLQQQASLPDPRWLWLLPLLVTPVFLPNRPIAWQRRLRAFLILLTGISIGFAWAGWRAQQRMADMLPSASQGIDLRIEGVVSGLPERDARGERFEFRVESVLTPGAAAPRNIRLTWPAPDWNSQVVPQRIKAGERWQWIVRLKRPHGTANPNGFDYEAWLLANNIRATGVVRGEAQLLGVSARPDDLIQSLRDKIRTTILKTLGAHPQAGVIVALAVGDQESIPHGNWRVYNRTGTSHLVSISGLHITLFAVLAGAVAYGMWRRVPALMLRLPARRAALLAGWGAALGYTLLAGFQIPAQRTLFMLTVLAAGLWLQRAPRPFSLLTLALFAVLVIDPWAVLSAGFWLSFGAVASMMLAMQGVQGSSGKLTAWMRAQAAVTLALAPALLLLFQQVSLISPLANAFAIPVVSWGVVPLTLLGTVFSPALSVAAWLMQWVDLALQWLSAFGWASWAVPAPDAVAVMLSAAGILWLLLPGLPARWLGVFLLLPLFAPRIDRPAPGAFEAEVLDVGQGTAVLIRTANHVLLYDTGPAFGDNDAGQHIVLPRLRALGTARLDGMMLTHDDSDHTGGAASVLRDVETGWLASSLPAGNALIGQARHVPCLRGQRWTWDGVTFEMLNPPALAYQQDKRKDNDKSCVLKIMRGEDSLLLTSDAERLGELEMTERVADKLPATVLMAGHHGSRTSSIEEFVNRVRPRHVIFSNGWNNRFGHPHPVVLARFRDLGATLHRTDRQGWIRLRFDESGLSIEHWRHQRVRYWQAPVME